MKEVIFFYPSKITGGAENLIKTTAELIKDIYPVKIVDIERGWLSENVQGIDLIILKDGEKIELKESSVLVTTANLVRYLDCSFYGDFKIIAWIVHPYNVIPVFPKVGSIQFKSVFNKIFKYTLLKGEYNALRNLISYLEKTNSLYAMDISCSDISNKFFGIKYKNYLPVVIPKYKVRSNELILSKYNEKKVNVLWLGRLDGEFKNKILIKVLKDLDVFSSSTGKHIVFNIIGDGPGYSEVEVFVKKLSNITVNFLFEKKGFVLMDLICSSDIGFAMGTSAIEIAACGVPTILLDFSYSDVSDKYKYRWIFQSTGYSLGRSIDAEKDKSMGNVLSMQDLIFALDSDKLNISKKCFEYVSKNHTVNILKDKISWAINNSNSSFKIMQNKRLFKKPYWGFLKLLSIKLKR